MFTSADERVIEQQKPDRNGTINGIKRVVCSRCNGTGQYRYVSMGRLTYGICFKCNGVGYEDVKFKKMTPEYRAKRDQINSRNQQKALEKRNAQKLEKLYSDIKHKGFDRKVVYIVNEADTFKIKDELKSAGALFDNFIGWYFLESIEKYSTTRTLVDDFCEIENSELIYKESYLEKMKQFEGEFLFEIGARFEKIVKYIDYNKVENPFAYRAYFYFYEFRDEVGNVFVWKTSKDEIGVNKGENLLIKAIMKDHTEWHKGKKVIRQNMIKNVRVSTDYK